MIPPYTGVDDIDMRIVAGRRSMYVTGVGNVRISHKLRRFRDERKVPVLHTTLDFVLNDEVRLGVNLPSE